MNNEELYFGKIGPYYVGWAVIGGIITKEIQGQKLRVCKVGNCPPSFWQNKRRRRAAAWRQRHALLLLAHPVLGSHLRP